MKHIGSLLVGVAIAVSTPLFGEGPSLFERHYQSSEFEVNYDTRVITASIVFDNEKMEYKATFVGDWMPVEMISTLAGKENHCPPLLVDDEKFLFVECTSDVRGVLFSERIDYATQKSLREGTFVSSMLSPQAVCSPIRTRLEGSSRKEEENLMELSPIVIRVVSQGEEKMVFDFQAEKKVGADKKKLQSHIIFPNMYPKIHQEDFFLDFLDRATDSHECSVHGAFINGIKKIGEDTIDMAINVLEEIKKLWLWYWG